MGDYHEEHEGRKFDDPSKRVIGCAIGATTDVHELAGIKTGLLMNFNVTNLENGIKRYVL